MPAMVGASLQKFGEPFGAPRFSLLDRQAQNSSVAISDDRV